MITKNARALILGVTISGVALYFALRNVDLSALLNSVLSAKPAWMLLVLIAYVAHYWLKAVRWCGLLEPVYQARTAEAYPVMMTGFFANNFLPAHLGEFVRMYVGAKLFKVSKTQVLATIVLERLLDFSTIALLFGLALVMGVSISDKLIVTGYVLITATLVGVFLLYLSLWFESSLLRFATWLTALLPDKLGERLIQALRLVIQAMHSMKSVRLVTRTIVLSLVQWLLVGLAIFAALQSVGVEITFTAAVITLAATVLAVSLPAAPGFFGTIQLAFVLALLPYGIAESDALAGSVIFHIISYLFVMVSGVIALKQLDMHVAELKSDAN